MRLLLSVCCLLGFASLPTLKASTSPTPAVDPSTIIPSAKPASLPSVTEGSAAGNAVATPSAVPTTGAGALIPSATASGVDVLSKTTPIAPSGPQVLSTSVSASVITVSSSGQKVIASTVASGSKPTDSLSKFLSPPAAATLAASTAAALTTSPSTKMAAIDTSAPDGSNPSAVNTQHSPTSARSSIPGSSSTGQSVTSALSPAAARPRSTAGPATSLESSEPTPNNVILDPSLEATSTVGGSNTPVIPPEKPGTTLSSASVSSTPAKIIWPSSFPGDQKTISSTPSPSQGPGSVTSGTPYTYYYPGIKLTCVPQDFPNQSLAIQTQGNRPSLCSDRTAKHAKELLAVLCESVTPGFKFNENKDNCTVKLAHKPEQPDKLAVLEVSVKTNAAFEDIDKALKDRMEELKKLGFLVDNKSDKGSPETYEDKISIPLIITIVCLAAALLLIAAIYSCCHQRQRHKKDQRLTEELQTMENGYHDNPTLEVMETAPEMQEKKPGLNGDLGDSWIVPMDNLMKDDMDEEEEDTHL